MFRNEPDHKRGSRPFHSSECGVHKTVPFRVVDLSQSLIHSHMLVLENDLKPVTGSPGRLRWQATLDKAIA